MHRSSWDDTDSGQFMSSPTLQLFNQKMARSSLLSWKWNSSVATAMRALLDVKQTAIQPMESRPGQISMDELANWNALLSSYSYATLSPESNLKLQTISISFTIRDYPSLKIPNTQWNTWTHQIRQGFTLDTMAFWAQICGRTFGRFSIFSRTKLQASKLRQRVEQTRRGGFPEVLFERLVVPYSVSTQTFQKLKSRGMSWNVMRARKWVSADLCRLIISQCFLAATLGYHKWLLKPSECCTFVCNMYFSSWCTSTKYRNTY